MTVGWISIKDELPEYRKKVLVMDEESDRIGLGYLDNDGKWWVVGFYVYHYIDNVTHWVRIPPRPKMKFNSVYMDSTWIPKGDK